MRKIECEQELDETFISFLDTLKPHSKNAYSSVLRYWINFSHMNGAVLLQFKRDDKDAKTEKLIMGFKQFMVETCKKSENFANCGVSAVRGFLSANRMPLTFTRKESERLQEAKITTEDYLFSKEEMAKMADVAPLFPDRYVLLVGKSIGLRAGDFMTLTYGKFRGSHLDGEAPVFIGETWTEKKHKKAFPFLDSDALQIVKTVLEANKDKKDTDTILEFTDENTLTQIIQRLFEKTGLQSGGKVVRFHNLRKYLIDRLSAVASESQWKQIVGKAIGEGAYVGQDQLRDVYLRAMPSIIINGNTKNHAAIEELKEALAQAEEERRAMRIRFEQLEQRDMERSKQIADLKEQFDSLTPEERKRRVLALRERKKKT